MKYLLLILTLINVSCSTSLKNIPTENGKKLTFDLMKDQKKKITYIQGTGNHFYVVKKISDYSSGSLKEDYEKTDYTSMNIDSKNNLVLALKKDPAKENKSNCLFRHYSYVNDDKYDQHSRECILDIISDKGVIKTIPGVLSYYSSPIRSNYKLLRRRVGGKLGAQTLDSNNQEASDFIPGGIRYEDDMIILTPSKEWILPIAKDGHVFDHGGDILGYKQFAGRQNFLQVSKDNTYKAYSKNGVALFGGQNFTQYENVSSPSKYGKSALALKDQNGQWVVSDGDLIIGPGQTIKEALSKTTKKQEQLYANTKRWAQENEKRKKEAAIRAANRPSASQLAAQKAQDKFNKETAGMSGFQKCKYYQAHKKEFNYQQLVEAVHFCNPYVSKQILSELQTAAYSAPDTPESVIKQLRASQTFRLDNRPSGGGGSAGSSAWSEDQWNQFYQKKNFQKQMDAYKGKGTYNPNNSGR